MGHKEDVEKYMAAMNVVVCASTKEKGLSGSLREAMALAKPVVSTTVSGNPEAVIPGKTGVLVPMGDEDALAQALMGLLSSPALAKRLGLIGRRLALRIFPDSKRARVMEALYREVVR